jgi:hypothetical protein
MICLLRLIGGVLLGEVPDEAGAVSDRVEALGVCAHLVPATALVHVAVATHNEAAMTTEVIE